MLEGCRTALDVGAGFGALALPLARRLDAVTAMEPSGPMAAALRRAAVRAAARNLRVIEAAWGRAPVARHDLVLCAHVGPLLGRGSAFLSEVQAVATRAVLLVRDAPGGDDKFFFRELYPVLLGRAYGRSSDERDTVEAVRALGVEPAVVAIEYASDQPFASLEDACDFWMTYMGLEGAEPRAFLRAFLEPRLQRQGEEWIAPFRKRAHVIAWRV